jgi:hypothetical protein
MQIPHRPNGGVASARRAYGAAKPKDRDKSANRAIAVPGIRHKDALRAAGKRS